LERREDIGIHPIRKDSKIPSRKKEKGTPQERENSRMGKRDRLTAKKDIKGSKAPPAGKNWMDHQADSNVIEAGGRFRKRSISLQDQKNDRIKGAELLVCGA